MTIQDIPTLNAALNATATVLITLGFIFITILIDIIGLGIIIPVLPKLISQLTGGGISDAAIIGGWLTFAYAITQFICAPLVGNLSDRFGRRPILLISLFTFLLSRRKYICS